MPYNKPPRSWGGRRVATNQHPGVQTPCGSAAGTRGADNQIEPLCKALRDSGMSKPTSKHHQGHFPSANHRVGFLLKETLLAGSALRQLGQEAPVKRGASGFPCREEPKPRWVGEDSWGELGWWQWSREGLGAGRGPHCQQLQAASSLSAGDHHHCPSSSSLCTAGPYARRGSTKPTHKAGHSALDDQRFRGSNVLNL